MSFSAQPTATTLTFANPSRTELGSELGGLRIVSTPSSKVAIDGPGTEIA